MPWSERRGQAAPFASLFQDVKKGVEELQIGYADIAPLAWQATLYALELTLSDFHAPQNALFNLFVN